MRKEVIFAVIFGIILGGIILFGINLANSSVNNTGESTHTPKPSQGASPIPTNVIAKTFDIITPKANSVTSETEIELRGISHPNTSVAIITEQDDLILESSPEGTFSAQIKLVSGANTIKVVQVDQDQRTETLSITVIQADTISE